MSDTGERLDPVSAEKSAERVADEAAGGGQPPNTTPPISAGGMDDDSWKFAKNKTPEQWQNQMRQRGWNDRLINEAINDGAQVPAPNHVNPGNPAVRYVHPVTGQSVVLDILTNEVIHVGGPGFLY